MINVETLMVELTTACEAWHNGLPANDVVALCENDIPQMLQQIIDRNKELEEATYVKDREYKEAILLANAYMTELKDLRVKISKAEKDAKRYLWLTEDHEDYATRHRCRSILGRMPVMSYSASCLDIDYAIAAQEKP